MVKTFGWLVCQVQNWLELGLMLLLWQILSLWKCKIKEWIWFQQSKTLGEEILPLHGDLKDLEEESMMRVQIGKFNLNGQHVQLLVEEVLRQNNKNAHHQFLGANLVLVHKFWRDLAIHNLAQTNLKSLSGKKLILLLWELPNYLTHLGDMKDVYYKKLILMLKKTKSNGLTNLEFQRE